MPENGSAEDYQTPAPPTTAFLGILPPFDRDVLAERREPSGFGAKAPRWTAALAPHTAQSRLRGAARAGANRLMSNEYQPFGASLRALRWSKLCRLSGIGLAPCR
ncbi:hypothetical protein TBK1r_55880 [Stieleria magnilauensis]|uniref:Uncharacterized protein n=1 Tax=Stieleria magnilauensis TaxID=2527963 RepID=A0ABX5XX65_9BACT|nr:hypothetical protein TBK1r_55880 [Planctomycetes bacterium TBK1r]